jgi:hypothetical protein
MPFWDYLISLQHGNTQLTSWFPNQKTQAITSYRPISLLLTLGKLSKKLLLKRITAIIHKNNILSVTQFGFRTKYNTIHQIHRITDHISTSFEKRPFCSRVFLDISQVFDRVWHNNLHKYFLPAPYYLILKYYLKKQIILRTY